MVPLVGVVMRTRAMYMARGMSLRRAMRMMTEMMVIWGGRDDGGDEVG